MSDQLTSDLESLKIDRDEPIVPARSSGRGVRSFVRLVVTFAFLGAIGAAGVFAYPRLEARIFKTEVRSAEISRVSPAQASTSVTATGYVIARTISRVTPRVPGRIATMAVHEGESVITGQVLFEMDASDPRSSIVAARARVLSAQARVAIARANLAEAQQQAVRQRRLVESGASPRSAIEDLDARIGPLQASVTAATAEVRALQSEVEVLRVGMSQLTIHAPFAGTILNRPPQVGEIVGPQIGTLEIADLASMVVEVDVPEARLALVRPGAPCEISLEAFPGRRLRGAVLEIGHRVDRARATVPIKVRFVDPMDGVLPEMSARVAFLTQEISAETMRGAEKTLVPASAVTTRSGAQVVFVIEDSIARLRPVRVGARTGDDFELLEGPSPGIHVVLNPPTTLQDGNPIKELAR